MADNTKIEWTEATWNIITGCTMVDAGCTNCYAMGLAGSRLNSHPSRAGLTRSTGGQHKWTGEVRFNEQWLDQPLRWKRGRMIFVCAHGDLFHENVPDEWIDRVFAVMALCPQHTFQVLTKRPERAARYLSKIDTPLEIGCQAEMVRPCDTWTDNWQIVAHDDDRGVEAYPKTWPLPNVWLGTSISDQTSADLRIPHLLKAPAAVRFLSAEPLLGPVDLTLDGLVCGPCPNLGDGMLMDPTTGAYECCSSCDHTGIGNEWLIDWVIVGGESGKNARPMHPDWARSIRDQCAAAGVPFFFKQWGEWGPLDTSDQRHGMISGNTPRAQWHDACGLIMDKPEFEDPLTFFSDGQMFRIGKARAGRLLDGQEWSQMPGGAA